MDKTETNSKNAVPAKTTKTYKARTAELEAKLKTAQQNEQEITFLKNKVTTLEESMRMKNQEYDKLLNAYRNLATRYSAAGNAAKQIVNTAALSMGLLFQDEEAK